MSKIMPITYEEVIKERGLEIPDSIIEAVNFLIKKNFNPNKKGSKVYIDEIIENSPFSYEEFDEKGWIEFDFECLYGKAGWNVEYFSPDFNEIYSPYFEFTKID
jgi:hypothetical protein